MNPFPNLDPRNYDISNMGPREDVVGEIYRGDSGEEEEMELGQMTPVNSLSLLFFQRQLVIHFTTLFAHNLLSGKKIGKGKGMTEQSYLIKSISLHYLL